MKLSNLVKAAAALAFLATSTAAFAQVSLTNGSPAYSQNFDALANTGAAVTWTNDTTITGWYSQRGAAGALNLTPGTGTSNTGAMYSYGVDTVAERALGTSCSAGTGSWAYGVRLKNDGTTNITDINVTVRGEQWRNGGNTTPQPLDFYYKVSATPITGITNAEAASLGPNGFTNVAALTMTTPTVGATAAALDGNNPTNQVNDNEIGRAHV